MYQSTFFNSDYLIDPPHAELGHTIFETKRLAIFCVFFFFKLSQSESLGRVMGH